MKNMCESTARNYRSSDQYMEPCWVPRKKKNEQSLIITSLGSEAVRVHVQAKRQRKLF